MNAFVFHVLFQVLALAHTVPVKLRSSDSSAGAGIPKSLRFIGTIEGKIYFADDAAKRGWTEARRFCNDAGMRLATITTSGQANFLAQQSASFNDYHWIGGRDLQTISQFAWDFNAQIVTDVRTAFYHGTGRYSCLRYNPGIGHTGQINSSTCTSAYPVICEIAHG